MAKLVGLTAKGGLSFFIQFAAKEALQALLWEIAGHMVFIKTKGKVTKARLTSKDAASIFPNTIHFKVFGESNEEIALFISNSLAARVDELLASPLVEVTPKKKLSVIPSFDATPKVIDALEACSNCAQPVVDEKKAFWIRRNRELAQSAREIAEANTGVPDKGFSEADFNVWFAKWVTEFPAHEAILRKMSTAPIGKLFPWLSRKRMLIAMQESLS